MTKDSGEKKPQVLKDLDTIVDLMTGADGGRAFMELLTLLRHIADDPAPSSAALREIVARFARLCRMAEEGRLFGTNRS